MKLLLNLLARVALVAVPCWLLAHGHVALFVELLVAAMLAFSVYVFLRLVAL